MLYWWTSFPFFHFESCEILKLSEIFFYFQVSIHVVFKQKLTLSTCVTTFTCSVMTDNINSWLATRPDELQQHHITLLSWHKTRVPDFWVKILIKQGERKKVGEIFYFILTLGDGNLKIWTSIKITQLSILNSWFMYFRGLLSENFPQKWLCYSTHRFSCNIRYRQWQYDQK